MIFQMMKKKGSLKSYRTVITIMTFIGIGLLIASRWLEVERYQATLSGVGTGITLVGAINIIMIRIKLRNEASREDMELSFKDERLQLQRWKELAVAGIVSLLLLCMFVLLNAFIDFDLRVGSVIVLFSYTGTLLLSKLYYNFK